MSRPAILQTRSSNPARLAAVTIRWASDATRIAEKTTGPLLDVFIRLWLAGIFWASGMVKLQSWTIALYLSAHEYPVSWLDPVTAAWLGEAIEIICPPLLVFGLATRFAALPTLILFACLVFLVLGAGKDHSYHTDWIERAGRPDLPAVDRSRLLSDGARAHCPSRTRGVVD
jgi:uncharacterized membrane protein YphA (DoxX/SURF4 family)